ncbi:MAG TPA: type II secretion system protein [Verrucomicrobiae bacterium]
MKSESRNPGSRGEGFGAFANRVVTIFFRTVPGENERGRGCRRAFTLLELLVVMAILALLAAVMLPALSRAKTKSRGIVCLSNLHQQGIALRMYLDQSDGVYPYVASIPCANGRGLSYWFDALGTTVSNAQWGEGIFKCPAYRGIHYEGETAVNAGGELTAVYAPCGSYAYNAAGRRQLVAGESQPASPGLGFCLVDGQPLTQPIRESQLKAPADLYAFGDARPVIGLWGPVRTQRLGGAADYSSFGTDTTFIEHAQHGTAFNMLFADAHAASIRTEVLLGTNGFSLSRWNNDHQP